MREIEGRREKEKREGRIILRMTLTMPTRE
jgi:hypothetical protein